MDRGRSGVVFESSPSCSMQFDERWIRGAGFFSNGIRNITIERDVAGDSSSPDDLSFIPLTAVPKPSTVLGLIWSSIVRGCRNQPSL